MHLFFFYNDIYSLWIIHHYILYLTQLTIFTLGHQLFQRHSLIYFCNLTIVALLYNFITKIHGKENALWQ